MLQVIFFEYYIDASNLTYSRHVMSKIDEVKLIVARRK